ncbi:MAG: hypothetical protein PF693_11420 [Spirochaetia bacterium]|jgi:hypothetical protein|nr:hypothetical protein [Spirochaetia bacterium]
MRRKVERISMALVEIIKTIPEVDSILLNESAETDIVNPYFFLSLDVYCRGSFPGVNKRRTLFENAGAFESSHVNVKDRFFMEDIPVRIEYKKKDRIDTIINDNEGNLWAFHDNGTYMFYRLQNGLIMYQQSDWIDTVRKKISYLPETFWAALRESSMRSMEHYLVDLSSAALNSDNLFYIVSLSGYLKYLCSFMFIINRKFEPSRRRLADQIMKLDIIPENFAGRFDSLIREDTEFPPSRKREVAKLLTKSLIYLF